MATIRHCVPFSRMKASISSSLINCTTVFLSIYFLFRLTLKAFCFDTYTIHHACRLSNCSFAFLHLFHEYKTRAERDNRDEEVLLSTYCNPEVAGGII